MNLFGTLRIAKQPEVRASATSALINATKLPNSGIAFVDNSQGSSAAIAELSNMLDIALEQFDYEGTFHAKCVDIYIRAKSQYRRTQRSTPVAATATLQ